MRKGHLLIALFVSVAVMMAPVSAQAIMFNTTGDLNNTNWIDVASWDWVQDNALAVDAVPLSENQLDPTTFDLYYQAKLGSFVDGDDNVITGTGLGLDYEITIEAGVVETGYRVDSYDAIDEAFISGAKFSLAEGTPNFFRMYYDTSIDANTYLGTGFNDGDLLLTGTVVESSGNFVVIIDYNVAAPGEDPAGDGIIEYTLLDQSSNGNQWGETYTLIGQGSTIVDAEVDAGNVNTNFFEDIPMSWFLDIAFNTSTITPFEQANPSLSVVGNAPEFGTYFDPSLNGGQGDFVTVNGLPGLNGPVDFLFQADGNSTIKVVPEPSTIALLFVGLVGLVGLRYRQRKG